jgi:hypothetical protein
MLVQFFGHLQGGCNGLLCSATAGIFAALARFCASGSGNRNRQSSCGQFPSRPAAINCATNQLQGASPAMARTKITSAPDDSGLHKFRTTFATWTLRGGTALPTLQTWMGHFAREGSLRAGKPRPSQSVPEKVAAMLADLMPDHLPASAFEICPGDR